MDDYLNSLNLSTTLKKPPFDDIEPSNMDANYQHQKEQDFEYQDHFIEVGQNFNNSIPMNNILSNELKQEHINESVFMDKNNQKSNAFLTEQRELLQKSFNEKQNKEKGMKYVMSEPKIEMRGSKSSTNLNFNNNNGNNQNKGVFNGAHVLLNQETINQNRNVKNTYIKKINSLINLASIKNENKQQQSQSIFPKASKNSMLASDKNASFDKESDMRRNKSFDSLSSNDSKKNTDVRKLENNRRSARNSRLRKKMYIELLENKVRQLNTEITETKQILEQNNENFNNICHNSKYLNSLVVGRQQLFEKLEKLFTADKPDEYQISLLIDSFRLRLGASGRERMKSIDYFFNQIIENFLPSSLKYLLLAASQEDNNNIENKFDEKNILQDSRSFNQPNFNNLFGNINLNQEQIKALKSLMKKLSQEKKKFDSFLKCLNEIKKNLHKHCGNLENIVDEISYSLNPIQIGRFLLTLEKERNRKEFSVEKLWFGYQLDQDDEREKEENGDSTPYSETFSVSAHNEKIKRASNYNDGNSLNDEDFQENDFFLEKLTKKVHK